MRFLLFRNYQKRELGYRSINTILIGLFYILVFTFLKAEATPTYYKYPSSRISIPIWARFTNREGRDDKIPVGIKIEKEDSLFYQVDSNVFIRLDSSKWVEFASFKTKETGYFKIARFVNLLNDIDRSNDTFVKFFWIKDTVSPWIEYVPLLYENFDESQARNRSIRQWLRPASSWHLRKSGDLPWDSNSTNYMCLKGDIRGNCNETLYSPNIICPEYYDTVKLKYRVLFLPKEHPVKCKAKVVYSIDGGKTWPYVLKSYDTYKNGYETINIILNSITLHSRVKIAWIYSGDLTDIVAWCIDDVAVIPTIITADDVEPQEICWPPEVITPNDTQSVTFIIRNLGGLEANNIKAEAWIGNAHSDTIIPYLPPLGETFVRLKCPVLNEGFYLMKVVTSFDEYNDDCALNDTLTDILMVIAPPSKTTEISEEGIFEAKPGFFILYQNQPNPFNTSTKIKYGLPFPSKVELSVYDITGQDVRKLFDGKQEEGYYEIIWNGRDDRGRKLPSGIYFYRLETEQTNLIKQIIITK
jgi:hypothetical protein